MWGGAAGVSEVSFPNLQIKKNTFLAGGVGGRGSWMDKRTGPNQLASSTSSKLGHNNALMYQLCK